MHLKKTTAYLFSALAFALAFAGCGTDPATQATQHGTDAQPILSVVATTSPTGARELLLLPMRSRVMPADWAIANGTRVSLADLEGVVDALPEGTQLVPSSLDAYSNVEGLLFELEGDELYELDRLSAPNATPSEIIQSIHGLAAAFNWGQGGTSKGNCYRYAVNDPKKPGEPHSPFPGGTDPGRRITCADIIGGAKKDGAKDTNANGNCPVGHYKICAAIQDTTTPGPNNDYHWWRNFGGGWTNKPGHGPEAPSGDPSLPGNRGSYDKFCGCLCVPLGPVFLDIDAAHAAHRKAKADADAENEDRKEAVEENDATLKHGL